MEARAIQIYKPVNKNEVRLVYRIKNSTVSGENGRHQKSYSFNKYGEENAWNMARDAFKFINSNNKLPFDFSDPWKMKLINKRGRKNLEYNGSSIDEQRSPPIISNKRLASLKNELYSEDLIERNISGSKNTVLSHSPPSISSVKYTSFKGHYNNTDSSSSPVSPEVSPNFIFKFEKNFSELDMKNNHQDYHLPSSSYLYLLATAATEIFEKQEIVSTEKVGALGNNNKFLQESNDDPKNDSISQTRAENASFDTSVSNQILQTNHQNQYKNTNLNQSWSAAASSSPLSQVLLPEIPKIMLNPESYYNLANIPYYNVPLYFNQASNQYVPTLINNVNQHLMLLDPSFQYLSSNNNNLNKIQIPK
ncbi:AP2 domain transcription factor AP2XII-8 [Cryptosporidium sp. chipmunk genotype I]|uniref:AP2 domain transcription factor AP2XII-8 n=1 Tax=Cryptosporidium sp. chipmunk genotype I TaxID=1280935 RepID=UPI00351A995C|nr:AP2 domain transcription factor AP2XII-8 [Cryptosporidium sp. chipmunk genotype I]